MSETQTYSVRVQHEKQFAETFVNKNGNDANVDENTELRYTTEATSYSNAVEDIEHGLGTDGAIAEITKVRTLTDNSLVSNDE